MKSLVLFFIFLSACSTINKKQLTEINLKEDKDISKFETKSASSQKSKSKPVSKKTKIKKGKQKEVQIVEKENDSQNIETPFSVGEKFTYNAYFRGMHAAQIVFTINDFKQVNEEDVYHFNMEVQSTGVMSKFYYLKMEANSFAKKTDLSSMKMTMVSQENNSIKKFTNLFEGNLGIYISESDSGIKKEKFDLNSNFHDVLSLIYFLRTINLSENSSMSAVYEKDVKKLKFSKIGQDKILYKKETIDTDIFTIQIDEKKEKAKMWVEKSKLRRVIKFEIPISLGTIKVDLQ